MRRPVLAALVPALCVLLGVESCPEYRLVEGPQALVPEERVRRHAREYLEYATAVQSSGSILNAIAHMERDRVDPAYDPPAGVVDEETWSGTWEKLDDLEDTRDFDGLYLLNALLGYEGHPYLTAAAWERVRTALRSFKMWYTDPTPPVPDPDDPDRDWDNSFYWTENHQILYHTIEYLMGQRFPDECFWIEGFEPPGPGDPCDGPGEMTGAEHRERAREKILRWLDERWEIGFVEWHSNIYYQKDATPLLTLVEYADDPEIATRAAMILDMLMLDLAVHVLDDSLGVTHGRSDMKDKWRGPVNDTWGIVHLMFRQQEDLGYFSRGDAGATLFARAQQYRLPQVVLDAALTQETLVDRERMSVWIDESAPLGDDPAHPPGHSFEDTEANFTFWWGIGAWTVWQVVPLTIANAERYNLWPTELLEPFQPLRDILGDPPNVDIGLTIANTYWPAASVGLLKEVNSYTYRTADYVLSTAQDYRKGANAGQVHAWQATFDPDTLVFTTHPMQAAKPPTEWVGTPDGEPGYWTGNASMPRSAQHENVGVHIYSPLYPDGGVLFPTLFNWEAETHAYFPRDRFDEWEQRGNWTFGRNGDAWIALYSWRPTVWRDHPPHPTEDVPVVHDLVAPGGADNVWIVECGRAADGGTYEEFVDAVAAAEVVVTPRAGSIAGIQEFDVEYESPSRGRVTFGWEAPFTVAGEELPLDGYPRMENPFTRIERGDSRAWIHSASGLVELDWEAGTRRLFARPEPPF